MRLFYRKKLKTKIPDQNSRVLIEQLLQLMR
ncbi:MAG: hypothetical protein ACI9DO_001803 [Reinekea sp.]|jgi:hypothetical protein